MYIYSSQTYITPAILKKTKMESDEDWINFYSKLLYDSSIKLYIRNTKDAKDFDLNVATDRGFDLNKYPDDGEEAFGEKELQQVFGQNFA